MKKRMTEETRRMLKNAGVINEDAYKSGIKSVKKMAKAVDKAFDQAVFGMDDLVSEIDMLLEDMSDEDMIDTDVYDKLQEARDLLDTASSSMQLYDEFQDAIAMLNKLK